MKGLVNQIFNSFLAFRKFSYWTTQGNIDNSEQSIYFIYYLLIEMSDVTFRYSVPYFNA